MHLETKLCPSSNSRPLRWVVSPGLYKVSSDKHRFPRKWVSDEQDYMVCSAPECWVKPGFECPPHWCCCSCPWGIFTKLRRGKRLWADPCIMLCCLEDELKLKTNSVSWNSQRKQAASHGSPVMPYVCKTALQALASKAGFCYAIRAAAPQTETSSHCTCPAQPPPSSHPPAAHLVLVTASPVSCSPSLTCTNLAGLCQLTPCSRGTTSTIQPSSPSLPCRCLALPDAWPHTKCFHPALQPLASPLPVLTTMLFTNLMGRGRPFMKTAFWSLPLQGRPAIPLLLWPSCSYLSSTKREESAPQWAWAACPPAETRSTGFGDAFPLAHFSHPECPMMWQHNF